MLNDGLSVVHDKSIADCNICPLVEKNGKCVKGQAPSGKFNKLMLIGEGPGFQETRTGLPFTGAAGKLLNALLEAAGIDRSECHVSNATLCMPDLATKAKVLDQAALACMPRLLTEIDHVKPRVIIAFGQVALNALTGSVASKNCRIARPCSLCLDAPKRKKSCPECGGYKTQVIVRDELKKEHPISKVSGATFDAQELGIPHAKYLIPIVHPAFLLHSKKRMTESQKKIGGQFLANAVVHHLRKAKRLLQHDRAWKEVNYFSTASPDVVAQYTSRDGWYTVDIETDSHGGPAAVTSITCIGIKHEDDPQVMVVDTDGLLDGELVDELRGFLADPAQKKVFQNGVYDTEVLWRLWGAHTVANEADTMIMHCALAPDEPHHLGHITFTYTDAPAWKPNRTVKDEDGEEKPVFESKEELHLYNARDLQNTMICFQSMRKELELEGVKAAHDIDIDMMPICREMQLQGMPVDLDMHGTLLAEKTAQMRGCLFAMREVSGRHDFNPNSAPQIQDVLFGPTGFRLPVKARTNTGQPATDKTALRHYAGHTFVDALNLYRLAKHVKTNILDLPLLDGRLHASWDVNGARTGRWTSSPNFMNWSKSMRALIRAPDGFKIVGADQAALELRITALLSGDPHLVRRCLEADETRKLEPEWDLHSYLASKVFGKGFTDLDINDPKQKKKRQELREVAKTAFYAMNYGAYAPTILEGIYNRGYDGPPITIDIVNRVLATVLKEFPGINDWRNRKLAIAEKHREIREPFSGRRRVFPLGDTDANVVYNFDVQASGAYVMARGLSPLRRLLSSVDPEAYFMAQVHDAIYIIAREARAKAVAELVEECMTFKLVHNGIEMPFVAKADIADRWNEC